MGSLPVRVGRRGALMGVRVWCRASWRMRPRPDFVVLGAMRAGTTTLFRDLQSHPQIVPGMRKEIHYLDLEHARGEAWYRAHFPTRHRLRQVRRTHGVALTGEATPNYLFHPYAPLWARHELPDTRFIVILRNPIDRAFSHWKLMTRLGYEVLDFGAAIEFEEERTAPDLRRLTMEPHHRARALLRHSYVARGLYAEQLERWFTHVDPARFLVVRSEDLYAEPASTFGRVTDFLGIVPWEPETFSHVHRTGSDAMNPDDRHHLEIAFKPHNDRLQDLLGAEFTWD